jgi:hypothetical protein
MVAVDAVIIEVLSCNNASMCNNQFSRDGNLHLIAEGQVC